MKKSPPDDQRPRTMEDMVALPEGPEFGQMDIIVNGRKVVIPVAPAVMTFWSEEGDPLGYRDADHVHWSLGRYADGRWYRQRRES
jgi:hypothetical protein